MSDAERMERQYPGIFFSDDFKDAQRSFKGFTFFRTIIKQHLSTGKPAFFNVGESVFKYEYDQTKDKSFMDGVTLVPGERKDESAEASLRRISEKYDLSIGFKEVREELAKGEKKGWFDRFKFK